ARIDKDAFRICSQICRKVNGKINLFKNGVPTIWLYIPVKPNLIFLKKKGIVHSIFNLVVLRANNRYILIANFYSEIIIEFLLKIKICFKFMPRDVNFSYFNFPLFLFILFRE